METKCLRLFQCIEDAIIQRQNPFLALRAVISGETMGNGALTLLGPTSHNRGSSTSNGGVFGGGLMVLNGALNHTGGLQVIGTNVLLGDANGDYLVNTHINLSAGATLGARGTQSYTIGNDPGQISFGGLTAFGAEVPVGGGFSAIGGVHQVTLNGGQFALGLLTAVLRRRRR